MAKRTQKELDNKNLVLQRREVIDNNLFANMYLRLKHIIYTKNIAKVIESLNIFTLKKYPLVNKETLFEYECFGDNQGAITESVLKNI